MRISSPKFGIEPQADLAIQSYNTVQKTLNEQLPNLLNTDSTQSNNQANRLANLAVATGVHLNIDV